MLDWKTVEDALKKYYQTNDEAILELMIKKLDPYIKTCAHNFVFKAR
ncbi:hypothetical protein ACTNBL_00165 [Enterococcus villorum]